MSGIRTRKIACNICREVYTVDFFAGTYKDVLNCKCGTSLIYFNMVDMTSTQNATIFSDDEISIPAIKEFQKNRSVGDFTIHAKDRVAFLGSRSHRTFYKGLNKWNKTERIKFESLVEFYSHLKSELGWSWDQVSNNMYDGVLSGHVIRKVYKMIYNNGEINNG